MALDTKQKRGSVLELSLPFREWLSDPDGSLAAGDRQALLKLGSAVAASAGVTIEVPVGALSLTGYAPTVVAPAVVSVPAGSLALTGYAPTVSTPRTVAVPAGSLELIGHAPTVVTGGAQIISVPAGVLSLVGHAPTVVSSPSGGGKGDNEPDRGWVFSRYRSFTKQAKEADQKKNKKPEPEFAKILGPNILAQYEPANPVLKYDVAEKIKASIKPKQAEKPAEFVEDDEDAVLMLLLAVM